MNVIVGIEISQDSDPTLWDGMINGKIYLVGAQAMEIHVFTRALKYIFSQLGVPHYSSSPVSIIQTLQSSNSNITYTV